MEKIWLDLNESCEPNIASYNAYFKSLRSQENNPEAWIKVISIFKELQTKDIKFTPYTLNEVLSCFMNLEKVDHALHIFYQ